MAWFAGETRDGRSSGEGEKRVRTEGLWQKCQNCNEIIWKKALDENLNAAQM
jgi:acetyl-CoA carboxylase carboxyl transferase subunit beta